MLYPLLVVILEIDISEQRFMDVYQIQIRLHMEPLRVQA